MIHNNTVISGCGFSDAGIWKAIGQDWQLYQLHEPAWPLHQ